MGRLFIIRLQVHAMRGGVTGKDKRSFVLYIVNCKT